MKTLLPHELREATRLTRAGRLLDATATIQRMLNPAASSGLDTTHADDTMTIEGSAEEISLSEQPVTSTLLGRIRGLIGRRAPGSADEPRARANAPAGVPQHLARTFSNAAGSRPYKLYIPSRYCGDPVPLIVMLHGCTQSADDFAAGTRMNEAGEANNCIIAYPEQVRSANVQKCWNWFKAGDQIRDAGEPSIIAGITREVMQDFAIDSRRVYIAGLSAGGAAAAVMAASHPDLYTAFGVHSGLANGAARDTHSAMTAMRTGAAGTPGGRVGNRAVPVIVFHGDRDTVVNPLNAGQVVAQAAGDVHLTARSEDGLLGGRAYIRTVFMDGDRRTLAEQWTIKGAGHAWSGGSPKGSFTDALGPNATQEMLRFFLERQI